MDDAALFTRSTCSTLLITFSDFRFKRVERVFAEQACLSDEYDLIARPGVATSSLSTSASWTASDH